MTSIPGLLKDSPDAVLFAGKKIKWIIPSVMSTIISEDGRRYKINEFTLRIYFNFKWNSYQFNFGWNQKTKARGLIPTWWCYTGFCFAETVLSPLSPLLPWIVPWSQRKPAVWAWLPGERAQNAHIPAKHMAFGALRARRKALYFFVYNDIPSHSTKGSRQTTILNPQFESWFFI